MLGLFVFLADLSHTFDEYLEKKKKRKLQSRSYEINIFVRQIVINSSQIYTVHPSYHHPTSYHPILLISFPLTHNHPYFPIGVRENESQRGE